MGVDRVQEAGDDLIVAGIVVYVDGWRSDFQ